MIYLSGVTNDRIEALLIEEEIGLMLNPGNSYHLRAHRYPWFAADNGCYAESTEHPFDEDRWIDRLAWLAERGLSRCLFATAPDVYPDSKASLDRGMPYAPVLREMGYPVAIVAQGTHPGLAYPWSEFDCLFIGGERNEKNPDAEWKVSDGAAALVAEARSHGLWVHMGRVNSDERTERAHRMGCLSVDGTAIKYRKRRRAGEGDCERHLRGEAEIASWVRRANAQPTFWRHETPAHPNHRNVNV